MFILKNYLLVFLVLAIPPKTTCITGEKLTRKKHEYYIQTAEDGSTKRNLEYTTTFDKRGNKLELIVWIPDSTYFSYGRCKQYAKEFNRPKLVFSDLCRYHYSSDTLMQITTFMCDSLPSKKQFFYYKRSSTGQVLEKKELSFKYETNKSNVENVSTDSILTYSSTSSYRYNKQGLKVEEINRYKDPSSYSYADTILYTYDSNQKLRRLEKILHDVTEISTYKYDHKGLLSNVKWKKPVDSQLNYYYDNYGQLIREVVKGGCNDIVFNYSYNGNGDLIKIVETDGYKIKITEFVYEYF